MSDGRPPTALELAVKKVVASVPKPSAMLPWQEMDEQMLWHELVACLLGSKVRFESAVSASTHLEQLGLLDPSNYDGDFCSLERRLFYALSTPASAAVAPGTLCLRYPYPRLRANHVRRTAENLYGRGWSLGAILKNCTTPFMARKELTAMAVGIGPKQASLFLRNVGYSDEIAVLDSHVLRYMCLIGLTVEPITTVQKIERYEHLERVLHGYARRLQASLAFLDTAIWVVMRVYQREANQWVS